MKEVKKILFCLFISIIFSNTVYAISVDAEDISDNSYVIGTNLFTADDNDIYNTEGKNTIYNEADGLFTPAVMFGASSINGSNYSDMVVYYIFDSVWYDALTLDELTAPKNVEITHVNGICVDSSCKGDKFTVTFNAQNFGQSKSVDFDYGDKITSSDLPKLNNRPGYRFVCWTKKDDDECFNLEEVKEKLNNHEEYVIRLKSPGNAKNTIEFTDCIKGKIKFPEHDVDTVLLKKDKTPTYHLAHAIDDHLMHTTHVIRGDEWVSSLPLHYQLFQILDFKPVKYAHIAPITIKDRETGAIRKISKRKDPWAGVKFYEEGGIPIDALHLYLATIANTNFEEWYLQNQDKNIEDFTFTFEKMAIGGTSFDEAKFNNICKTYFSRKSGEEVYKETLEFARKYDKEYAKLLEENERDMIQFLSIEKDGPRPRKDIAKYSDVKEEFSYATDEQFTKENFSKLDSDKDYDINLVLDYINNYLDLNVTNEEWFNDVKKFAVENGYAASPKEYKNNPDNYKGHVGDICEAIRVMITGRRQSPDLFSIMKILGKNRLVARVELFKNH